MKYVEPEMEVVEWDAKVMTELTGASSDKDGGVPELGDGTPL